MATSRPNWLSGQDVTSIATDRSRPSRTGPAAAEEAGAPVRHRSGFASTAGAVTFVAAVWLIMSSYPLYYYDTGSYEAYWNDAVIGAAIAAVSLARAAKPTTTRPLGWVNVVLGGWVLVAPFAWGYHDAPGAAWTVRNDIVVGAIVTVLSLLALTPRTPD
jgi:hypothetical protein